MHLAIDRRFRTTALGLLLGGICAGGCLSASGIRPCRLDAGRLCCCQTLALCLGTALRCGLALFFLTSIFIGYFLRFTALRFGRVGRWRYDVF